MHKLDDSDQPVQSDVSSTCGHFETALGDPDHEITVITASVPNGVVLQ